MKCLTVRQPYAALLVYGLKTIECRTRLTAYRGKLLIHAGKQTMKVPEQFKGLLAGLPRALADARGCIIGRVSITGARPFVTDDITAALVEPAEPAVAWVVSAPEVIDRFIPLLGRLSMFPVPDDLIAEATFAPAAPSGVIVCQPPVAIPLKGATQAAPSHHAQPSLKSLSVRAGDWS